MSTILIAYEREMEQNALEKLLAERGHTVIRSNNGVDALEAARRESPNLIISDISLPKMDGFSLCKKWKQDEHLQTVPFMFYTRRHDDPKYERFALELGVDRFIERTNDHTAFFDALDNVLADGAVAKRADTMKLQALTTGAFLTTGRQASAPTHLTTQSQLATTIVAPRVNGNGAATTEEKALKREARLLTKVAELDAQNKQLQTGEQKLRETLDTQMRAAAHIADTYSALQVAAADGFWLVDENERIRDTNEAYCRLSGYGKEDLLKLKAGDLDMRWRDDAATHSEVLRDEGQIRYQTQHKRRDGSLCDVEVSIGTVTGAQSRRIVIIRDVTARTRRNEVAKRLERTKEAALEIFASAEGLDETAIARRVVELAASLSESPNTYLCVVDSARNSASLSATFETGTGAVAPSADQRVLPHGPWIDCAKAGKPQFIEDNGKLERAPSLPAQQRALLLPVSIGNGMTAVVCVANRSVMYTENDATALAPLVNATGVALRSKHAHVQNLMSSQRAEVALQGTIEALSKMTERHDPHTVGVARRVSALSVALARDLGLAQREQNALRTASLLYRIGLISVPSALLTKPGELTAVELALVRTYVEESHKILAEIEFGAPIAEIVYQHRERLDGSGYPRGLKGDQISLEARILGVADAVVSGAAKHGNIDAALKDVEGGADRSFDKRVVEACGKLFREQGYVLPA